MRLTADEEAMLAGHRGPAVQRALRFLLAYGAFFGAEDLVPVSSAHLLAEVESMGEMGLRWLEELAVLGGRCAVPTSCAPRSVDFDHWRELGQSAEHVAREERLSAVLDRLGVMQLDTSIAFQSVSPPRCGEHLAWGDTGSIAFANGVAGARTNYEGGPAALAAALTGRVPRYGYHLAEHRRGSALVEVRDQPHENADWGVLGCIIGRMVNDYWQVPVLVGIETAPTVDQLKHLAAALASYGSLAMFHVIGMTPEARTVEEAFDGQAPRRRFVVELGMLAQTYRGFQPEKEQADVVVFSAPQLSILELRTLAQLFAGRKVHPHTAAIASTNYQNYALAEHLGYLATLRDAGVQATHGTCFFLMTPRELAERRGWRTLVTDSAKLANIIAGYGYNPVLRPTAVCVEAATMGRLPW